MKFRRKVNYKGGPKDLCQTPGYALAPIMERIIFKNSLYCPIWECASGEGYLVRELGLFGSKVISTDIITGQDFLTYTPDFEYQSIITNPPFSLKHEFLARCYELEKPFALLMPVEVLGNKTAQDMFREYGIDIIFMDRRINFKMPNMGWGGSGADFPVAWFTKGLGVDKMEFYSYNWLTTEKRKEFEI